MAKAVEKTLSPKNVAKITKEIQKVVPQKAVNQMAKAVQKAVTPPKASSSQGIFGTLADAAWSIFKP